MDGDQEQVSNRVYIPGTALSPVTSSPPEVKLDGNWIDQANNEVFWALLCEFGISDHWTGSSEAMERNRLACFHYLALEMLVNANDFDDCENATNNSYSKQTFLT